MLTNVPSFSPFFVKAFLIIVQYLSRNLCKLHISSLVWQWNKNRLTKRNNIHLDCNHLITTQPYIVISQDSIVITKDSIVITKPLIIIQNQSNKLNLTFSIQQACCWLIKFWCGNKVITKWYSDDQVFTYRFQKTKDFVKLKMRFSNYRSIQMENVGL